MKARSERKLVKRKLPRTASLVLSPSITTNLLYLPAGYSTWPSQQQIAASNFQVPNLRISFKSTSIEWKGRMNLRLAVPTCLAELIDLGSDYVEVYRDQATTPPRGQGFNRQCVATFANGSDYVAKCTSYKQLIQRMRKICRDMDCELLSFDVDTGVWKTKVSHFTKLKFEANFDNQDFKADNIDEAEDEDGFQQQAPALPSPMIFPEPTRYPPQLERSIPRQPRTDLEPDLSEESPLFTDRIDLNSLPVATQHNLRVNKRFCKQPWMQLRFGGNGMKYFFQRSSSTYWVNGTREKRDIMGEAAIFLEPTAPRMAEFEKCVDEYLKINNLPERTAYLLTLVHILFGRKIKYTMRDGSKTQLPEIQHSFEKFATLRTWLQSKIKESDLRSQSDIIGPLALRKVDQLCARLINQRQYILAQIVSKIEDPIFRKLYIPAQTLPTQLQLLLLELISCAKNESWLIQVAIAVWYFFVKPLTPILFEILASFFKQRVNHQNQFRVFRLHSLMRKDNHLNRDNYADDRSLDEDLHGWFLSNLLSQSQKNFIKSEDFRKRRFREIWNLLSKLSPRDGLRLVDKDTFLDPKTKAYLFKVILRKMTPQEIAEVNIPDKQKKLQDTEVLAQRNAYEHHHLQSIRAIEKLAHRSKQMKNLLIRQTPHSFTPEQKSQILQNFRQPSNTTEVVFANYLMIDLQTLPLTESTLKNLVNDLEGSRCGHKLTKQIVRTTLNRILEKEFYFQTFFKNQPDIARKLAKLAKEYATPYLQSRLKVLINM